MIVAEHETIDRAVAILKGGGLVAFPTETLYVLGADAENPAAVARLAMALGEPPGRALTVYVGPRDDFARWGAWSDRAAALAERFWPGPLTLIVPRSARVPDLVTGGAPTVALGASSHPVAVALLDTFGGGVAAAPASRTACTTADQVRAALGDAADLLLEGGDCPVGVESTALTLAEETPRVLRLGAAPVYAIEAVIGRVVVPSTRGGH